MKPTSVLPLLICLGVSACGGGGGGSGSNDDVRNATIPPAETNRFANRSDFIPFADSLADDFIAATADSQPDQADSDLTGTWVYLEAEAGADQIMADEPENQSDPLDTSSYYSRQVLIFSVQDFGDTLIMFECAKFGQDGVGGLVFSYTRGNGGNSITMWEGSEDFAHTGTVENNRVLRFSNVYGGSKLATQLDNQLHRFTSSTSMAYVKISSQVDAIMGILNDAAYSDEPVLCASMGLYEWFEGMFPAQGRQQGYNSFAELTHFVPELAVDDMPTSQYEWLGRNGLSYLLQDDNGAGKLQLLVE